MLQTSRIPVRFLCRWLVFLFVTFHMVRGFDQRLANLSTLGQTGPGESVLSAGFVVGQGARKPVLIRAVGPGLKSFGVTGLLSNPVLHVFNSSGLEIANNDDWSADPIKMADLSAAFSTVGAFALPAASLDSSLIVFLDPGAYTVQAAGLGAATGKVLVEVYDLSGPSRLVNLSARGTVVSNSSLMVNGLVVASGKSRRVLLRAVGPTLADFGVKAFLASPVLDLRDNSGATLMANKGWETGADAALVASEGARAGAFPLRKGSQDSALIAELGPGSYTVLVSGDQGAAGVVLVEAYDLSADGLSVVNVKASIASTDTSGGLPAQFSFTRTGDISKALTVGLKTGGTAMPGVDYQSLPAQVSFPAGGDQLNLSVVPLKGNGTSLGGRTLELSLVGSSTFGLGDSATATVTIFSSPGTLYLTSLRPVPAAAGVSVASGTATIQLSPDNSFALVGLSFSNLSSGEVVAHLAVGGVGETGPYVLRIPNGQVSGLVWQFTASGSLSAADLIKALQEGRIYLSVDSAQFPEGELRGQFIQSTGSMSFAPPSAAPALSASPLTAAEVARFLTQASFGPTQADVNALTGKTNADLDAWITRQQGLAATSHQAAILSDFTTYGQGQNNNTVPSGTNRQAAWWKISLTAPDQLRQRVAFALSELFVVSDQNGTLNGNQEALAAWYDMLGSQAFGSYRTLLEKVALSPVMGTYLSHLRNRKADPKTGLMPDENFAREIMQLFSIGLVMLQPDGTLQLSTAGLPVPTYDNKVIPEMARVFTGFAYYTPSPASTPFMSGKADYLDPMTLFPAYHDDGEKVIVTGRRLPANQGGLRDLADALDTLAGHQNTGPFVCRQLIQKLVTSNPSPAYVYRVSQVFADNGHGVRGDLGAVVRAILMDYEARSPLVAKSEGFGKLKEPLLRVTGLLRAFSAAADNGRYPLGNANAQLGQAALSSPTVFNFFEPGFVLPGSLAAAGLYAPEYQILTDSTAISVPNVLYGYVFATRGATAVGPDYGALLPLASSPEQLADAVNLLCCAGNLGSVSRARVVSFLKGVPASTSALDRVRSAVYLSVVSPYGAVQR